MTRFSSLSLFLLLSLAETLIGATLVSAANVPLISRPYKPQKFNLSPQGDIVSPFSNEPPYGGTGWDINTFYTTDTTTYTGYTYKGTGIRYVYDRRVDNWLNMFSYLYDVTFDNSNNTYTDPKTIEFVVDYQIPESEALQFVGEFGMEVGTMPAMLVNGVGAVWIMPGDEDWGGGPAWNSWEFGYVPRHMLIHTGATYQQMVWWGATQEILIHEACHAALDEDVYADPDWYDAANEDGEYISVYAQDYPNTEDVAETCLVWLAVRYQSDRLPASDYEIITNTIPNRLKYLDGRCYDVSPLSQVQCSTPAPTPVPTPVPTRCRDIASNIFDLPKIGRIKEKLNKRCRWFGRVYKNKRIKKKFCNRKAKIVRGPRKGQRVKLNLICKRTCMDLNAGNRNLDCI